MPRTSPEAVAKGKFDAQERLNDQRARIASIKETAQCSDCDSGIWWPACALQFDHLPGEQKLGEISRMSGLKWRTIQDEIAKTEVVCANHHAIRTANRRKRT